jgi:hypothetical protein
MARGFLGLIGDFAKPETQLLPDLGSDRSRGNRPRKQ